MVPAVIFFLRETCQRHLYVKNTRLQQNAVGLAHPVFQHELISSVMNIPGHPKLSCLC